MTDLLLININFCDYVPRRVFYLVHLFWDVGMLLSKTHFLSVT